MKNYVVVYLSDSGMHERFRCTARNVRQAKRYCRECMGVDNEQITDVYLEWE